MASAGNGDQEPRSGLGLTLKMVASACIGSRRILSALNIEDRRLNLPMGRIERPIQLFGFAGIAFGGDAEVPPLELRSRISGRDLVAVYQSKDPIVGLPEMLTQLDQAHPGS